MKENRFVTYTEDDRNIVRAGIEGVREILLGGDADRKRSMLFCLDWFMDPYYGQDISAFKEELIELLQQVIVAHGVELDVKEDALQLLEDYEFGPFPILEEHFEELEEDIKPDAKYVINMHREFGVRTLIFLGSSVTYGEAAGGISFADLLCKKFGYEMVKEAVSGTTLVDDGPDSYVSRLKTIDAESASLLVCQLSTNDATCMKPLGSVGKSRELESFDTKTVAGAIEYIIAYARVKWGCPVTFYTSPRYESKEYAEMVELLKKIAKKWDIELINLWDDKAFNKVTAEERARFMADPIHPTLEGYKEWWLPYFEKKIPGLF